MNEIKLRVWDEQTQKMWYTHPDRSKKQLKISIIIKDGICFDFGKGYPYDPGFNRHIMQYTGQRDKNWTDV